MLGLALLGTSQMHALFQRHPLASNLLEHFSTCLRCTCSIYQLAPHSLQSFPSGLWPLTLSMLPFPKKSKSHQSFGCANLGPQHQTLPQSASTFHLFLWCLPSKLWDSSWPLFLYLESRLSLLLFQRGFYMVLLFFLACIFLGLCFLYLFQSRCRPFQCLFQSRCLPFQLFFPIPQGSLQTILFQRYHLPRPSSGNAHCSRGSACFLSCACMAVFKHRGETFCYPWKHHCFLFSAFSLSLLLPFPFPKEVPLV